MRLKPASGLKVVAPRAGARIETTAFPQPRTGRTGRSPRGSADRNSIIPVLAGRSRVAPRAGARIETRACRSRRALRRSLPARERGSKQPHRRVPGRRRPVAPRAGARIETRTSSPRSWTGWSLPARERGSKRINQFRPDDTECRSPGGSADRNNYGVVGNEIDVRSLPARECGSKHLPGLQPVRRTELLPARERGSKPARPTAGARAADGRSPRGSADRNEAVSDVDGTVSVAPQAGARTETRFRSRRRSTARVAPRTGARIETPPARQPERVELSLPARERGRSEWSCRSPRGSADRNIHRRGARGMDSGSLPARERGSKPAAAGDTEPRRHVAPRVGSAD